MISNFREALIVFCLCLTFVGQAMASTVMSYHMIEMKSHELVKDKSESNSGHQAHHAHHIMNDDNAENTKSEDCCVKTCSCFTGGCSSLAALLKGSSGDSIFDTTSKIISPPLVNKSKQPTSLYRPPILS